MTITGFGSFLIFIVVLSGLIFVHELGHFLAAKRLGIHVEEFALGFPPRLIGFVRDDRMNVYTRPDRVRA